MFKNHVLRAQNLGNIAPIELRRPDLGALEASRKERNGQESFEKLPKSSQVTIPGACRQIMSSQGAAKTPQRAPEELLRSFLRAYMRLGETQKSSPEAPKSLDNDLKIKNVDVHETLGRSVNIIDVSSPEG